MARNIPRGTPPDPRCARKARTGVVSPYLPGGRSPHPRREARSASRSRHSCDKVHRGSAPAGSRPSWSRAPNPQNGFLLRASPASFPADRRHHPSSGLGRHETTMFWPCGTPARFYWPRDTQGPTDSGPVASRASYEKLRRQGNGRHQNRANRVQRSTKPHLGIPQEAERPTWSRRRSGRNHAKQQPVLRIDRFTQDMTRSAADHRHDRPEHKPYSVPCPLREARSASHRGDGLTLGN